MGVIQLAEQKRAKILAVDDEEEIRKLYESFLGHEGYEITVVESADQCIEAIRKNRPDLILMDVNMPGVGGLRLLEMIRAFDSGESIAVMMISGRRDEKTIKEAALLGCDDFIVKPFDLKELSKRIALEIMVIDYGFVIDALKTLHMQKNSVLRQVGLTMINSLNWDCYPFTRDNNDFCVVITRGVRPQAVVKLRPEELEKNIRIFCKRTLRWRQVWPK